MFVICTETPQTKALPSILINLVSTTPNAALSCQRYILLRLFVSPSVVSCSPPSAIWVRSALPPEVLRITAIMSKVTADGGDEQVQRSSRHSPLASQRDKVNNTSTETKSRGRTGGYFTLGYKEGFSQWVTIPFKGGKCIVLIHCSGQIYQLPKPNILFFRTFLISISPLPIHKREKRYPLKLQQRHPSQTVMPTRPRPSRRIQIAIHTGPGNGIQLW